MIYPDHNDAPSELLNVQQIWKEKADRHGNSGSCVIGAGFVFQYKDKMYKMPPISKWQGNII